MNYSWKIRKYRWIIQEKSMGTLWISIMWHYHQKGLTPRKGSVQVQVFSRPWPTMTWQPPQAWPGSPPAQRPSGSCFGWHASATLLTCSGPHIRSCAAVGIWSWSGICSPIFWCPQKTPFTYNKGVMWRHGWHYRGFWKSVVSPRKVSGDSPNAENW